MSATVYRDTNFQGAFAHLRPGFVSGRGLVGYLNRSTHGEDLDNEISSVRVGPNTIVVLFTGQSMSASGGSRVLIGPTEISDLGGLGLDNQTSAIRVLSFKRYDSAIPRGGGVVLCDGYQGQGKKAYLGQGDYDAARLASEEVKFSGGSLRSVQVSPNTLAVLYDGPNFDQEMDAVVVVGPTMIGDLDSIGLAERVSSVRVMHTDPYDVPERPSTSVGSTRTNYPGGAMGFLQTNLPLARRPIQSPEPTKTVEMRGGPVGKKADPTRAVWVALVFLSAIVLGLLLAVVTMRRAQAVDALPVTGAAEGLPSVVAGGGY